MKRKGSPLLGLIIGILILAFAVLQMNSSRVSVPSGPGNSSEPRESNPIERSFEAVCGVNKVAIQNALQAYNLSHEPMKTLDLQTLSGILKLPEKTPGNKCTYLLDEKGNVVCEVHH